MGCVSAAIAGTNLGVNKKERKRLTDSEVNVFWVLAFLSVGDGGTEAQHLMGLLDLPRATSMEKSIFSTIEQAVQPIIIAYGKEILQNNLINEVTALCHAEGTFVLVDWLLFLDNPAGPFPEASMPHVKASNDMRGQKRSIGRRHESLSGHSFFCGAVTRKPIVMVLMQKYCHNCSLADTANVTPVDHTCSINHIGSSGSMEASALVEMFHNLYDTN